MSITFLFGITIIAITVSAFTAYRTSRFLLEEMKNEGIYVAKNFAKNSVTSLLAESPKYALETSLFSYQFKNVDYVAIYDSRLKILTSNGTQPKWKPTRITYEDTVVTMDTDDLWHIVSPVIARQMKNNIEKVETIGVVHIVFNKKPVRKIQQNLFLQTLVSTLLISSILLVVLIYLARIITDPIESLSTTLTTQHPFELVELPIRGNQDVRNLTVAFNRFIRIIKQNTSELEREVEERTSEVNNAFGELRRLMLETNRMLEDERIYVTNEIHEHLNAKYIALKWHLEGIVEIVEKGKEIDPVKLKTITNKCNDILEELYINAREILKRLRPEIIETAGLVGALEESMKNWAELKPDCVFDLDIKGDLADLDENVQIAIYRVIQECITNTVKHADAHNVNTTLTEDTKNNERVIVIETQDNGIGFDTEQTKKGLGLIGIRERIHAYQGEMIVKSEIGKGTKITATIRHV